MTRQSVRYRILILLSALLLGFTGTLDVSVRAAIGGETERKPGVDPKSRAGRTRTFDVQRIRADLILDVDNGFIRGSVAHAVRPLDPGMRLLVLDCGERLDVAKVELSPGGRNCVFSHEKDQLKIQLDRGYDPNEEITVKITYEGKPSKGLFFVKPNASAPDRPLMVWTQGQAEENREWLPCYDYPNDFAALEMNVTVRKPFFVLSNGVLSETKDNDDGSATYRWRMDHPHVSYLITLAAAEFAVYRDKAGDIPVDYYVAKNVDEATARGVLGRTPGMVKFFADLTGVPYPYPKYAQVCVPNFTNLGMENASATTLTDAILIDPIEQLEQNSDDLIAHELAHQWFGDLLTCEDWGHIWLNESFATYAEALWDEHVGGKDALQLTMAAKQAQSLLLGERGRKLVERDPRDPSQLFDLVAYDKGGCILHMLRNVVGDRAWSEGVRRYVGGNRYKTVITADLQAAMEQTSGQDLSWFFEQWGNGRGVPTLTVSWSYDPAASMAKLSVKQTQKGTDVPFYRLPTTVLLGFDGGKLQRVPIIIEPLASQEFAFPAASKPAAVEIDPDGWLLKSVTQKREREELVFLLTEGPSVTLRLLAARGLARQRGEEEVEQAIGQAWRRESDRRARSEMVRLLRSRQGRHRESLLEAAKDNDARVRREAFEAFAALDPEVEVLCRAALINPAEAYGVRRTALQLLTDGDVKDREALLESALAVKSPKDTIATEALTLLLRAKTDSSHATAVRFAQPGPGRSLRRMAIHHLTEIADKHEQARQTLVGLISDPDSLVRFQVWDALVRKEIKSALGAMEMQLEQEDDANRDRLKTAIKNLRGKSE